ncbi:hypothetical protein CCAX7_21130 [Capsulimonas corticalis]|uniref:Uncharacterized protein n=1 Tax=Capsulimonas corticalis TaxID=2219043 RepID=A0A402D1Z8_9BACT|nr:hypothetical protein [Capsulimonas corticalis]BDI30062.1 hypothetical protein CCAX7_21130 [Capsulimonas corticalis]
MNSLKVVEIIDLSKSFDIAYPKTVSVASNGLDKIYVYERVSQSILCVQDQTEAD